MMRQLPHSGAWPLRGRRHVRFHGSVLIMAACLAMGHPPRLSQAQVLPPERHFMSAWQASGVPVGIRAPDIIVNVRDLGATGDGTTDDAKAVQAAIRSLRDTGGVVFFPPGIYHMEANLTIGSGIVLRGHRAQTATLRFNTPGHCISITGQRDGPWQPIRSGFDLHSSVIEVSDGSIYEPGDMAETHQDLDPAWKGVSWDACGQMVHIAAVAGNTLHLEQPLRLAYQAVLAPRIRRIRPAVNSGVENLKVERLLLGTGAQRNNHFNIRLFAVANSHVRGVESVNAWGGHIGLEYSTRSEVTGCYLHHAWDYDGGGSGYGTRLEFKTGECRIENNILHTLRHALLQQAFVNGNVVAYNYSFDVKSDAHGAEAGDLCMHGNYPYANLFEGNIVQHIWLDNSHGANGPHNVYFRNRAERNGFNMTDPIGHRQSVIGNELFRGGPLVRMGVGNGYRFQGTDHFRYGNHSIAAGLDPEGSGDLADYSYYLGPDPSAPPPVPSWWNIPEPIPTIGPPLPLEPAKNIPARARWLAGTVMTVGPPSLYRQPSSQTVGAGETVVFSVGAVGTPAVSFQWYHNGRLLPGRTGAVLEITAARPAETGIYHAIASDPGGSVRSADAVLAIRDANGATPSATAATR